MCPNLNDKEIKLLFPCPCYSKTLFSVENRKNNLQHLRKILNSQNTKKMSKKYT